MSKIQKILANARLPQKSIIGLLRKTLTIWNTMYCIIYRYFICAKSPNTCAKSTFLHILVNYAVKSVHFTIKLWEKMLRILCLMLRILGSKCYAFSGHATQKTTHFEVPNLRCMHQIITTKYLHLIWDLWCYCKLYYYSFSCIVKKSNLWFFGLN